MNTGPKYIFMCRVNLEIKPDLRFVSVHEAT
jgi:hypothetical protein